MTTVLVAFRFTWLTNPVTGVSVSGPNPVRAREALLGGSVRPYAGGRMRVITTPSDVRTYTVVLQNLSDADLLLVDSWRGQVLLLRDAMGWRAWVTILDIKVNSVPGPAGMVHDVTITPQEISYSEAV